MKMKKMIMVPMMVSSSQVPAGCLDLFSHPVLLGAHRYTTGGGTARPAGGLLSATQPRGDAALPLRCARHTYPSVCAGADGGLNVRASPSIKFTLLLCLSDVALSRPKARCRHGN